MMGRFSFLLTFFLTAIIEKLKIVITSENHREMSLSGLTR